MSRGAFGASRVGGFISGAFGATSVALPSRAGLRVPYRVVLLALLAAVGALTAVALASWGSGGAPARTVAAPHRVLGERSAGAYRSPRQAGLLSLPAAAQASVSAALGRDQAAYRIRGLVARNPAQRLSARFGRSGVAIKTGSARFGIALKAFGRAGALRALSPVVPVASADRVSYARGPVREWWVNGPLGLEQGFTLARRPAGPGALTLSLAVSGRVRLDDGAVVLPGGLRYGGVQASDARGRALPAWLQVRGGRVLVRVNDRGARYPLRIDPFVEQAELTASDASPQAAGGDIGDQFGYSVATSGNTIVVGAPDHAVGSNAHQGAVYVFEMPKTGGWASATQTAELTDSAGSTGEELGYSVAISGDTIAAGEPSGTELPGNSYEGGGEQDPQGTVDVFTTTGAWTSTSTPNARLTVSTPESTLGGELGWSVAISGSTIVAGAPDDPKYPSYGEAYVFSEPGGGWSGPQTQTAELSANNPSNPNGGEYFGWSVGVSGTTIVVGAYGQNAAGGYAAPGAAYVFTMPAGGWVNATQTAELTTSDNGGYDDLGWSVAVSGNTVVAGAYNHAVGSSQQGAAYVFVMPAGGWVNATQSAELTASDGRAGDALGWSVAISGSTIVAGALDHPVAGNDSQGAAYVFAEPTGGWKNTTQSAELAARDGAEGDSLGDSVAISGSTIVAGALDHQVGGNEREGAAYVFGPGSVVPPPPVTHPTAKVGSISGGAADVTVALSCPAVGAACPAVSLNATVTEHLKGQKITAITASGAKKKPSTKKRVVVVASARATLAAGARKILTLRLNSTGRALLSKFGRLTAIVTVSSGGKTTKTLTVKVRKPAKPKKRK
jgi:hypothetical protein